jgi:LysM repeat protein
MSDKDSNVQNVIDSYRKRQQSAKRAPLMVGLAAVFLVIGVGLIIVVVVNMLNSPNGFSIKLFATDTLTPTLTSTSTLTPTPTNTPTVTPTETPTEMPTVTATVAGPFIYQVESGDSCYTIAFKYKVDLLLLITINNLTPECPINPGDLLTIPGPTTQLPTTTAVPVDLPRGTKIQYIVQTGDSLLGIALKFFTTIEAILKENPGIKNENDIKVGQLLIVPVNLVPTVTPAPPTPTGSGTPTLVIGTPVNLTPSATRQP